MSPEEKRKQDLKALGLKNLGQVYWNLSTPGLYEEAIKRREGVMAHLGPMVVRTGQHTGRSPHDKFMVREPSSQDRLWWGDVNKGLSEEKFNILLHRLMAYVQGKDLFVQDCYAGQDPEFRVPIRVITETAWHNLFARNLFVQVKDQDEMESHYPEFTIINAPRFQAVPELDGTYSEAFIIVNLGRKLILIGGTAYAGEIKKSVFTLMNYLLPQKEVLSMHCSVNVGQDGDAAVFFGLSGTGKTTLSADPERALIGDDEHGWSDRGLFNFEGGCYAKVIRLSKTAEPEIYECTRKFGTILENVGINLRTRRVDLDDDSLTENTRAAYPIAHIPSAMREGVCGHPKNVVMLTCDAFGVMPPLARLTAAQAEYHFLSGYTAKVAGTEAGVNEPKATFSTCFGAPFMALEPHVYADLLRKKVLKHQVKCWLLNTGWAGEPASKAGRISIKYSRALVKAALTGALDNVKYRKDPLFNFEVPVSCPGVPGEILNPRNQAKDPAEYDQRAQKLVEDFKKNFEQFAAKVPDDVKNVL
ncbi:Phosphoenolpyruvate (PEP) carboxykinase [Desulfatibacillum aliphaticivorans]|uniref:Phosphoenolpyruvate carboxykinase (ATP) n=1 Tax=Desulfatibacillum aliphaticivorans TaxID=218208 RepID=B8FID1_DESAL|nr:phosphoenolpyruvate carboxykinase (ATP) [Desulfatibacillum aliphaticivorans]ACL03921.1 Phosphoenolpyruvate (PEP) carboxykinase [Desulfatibacillum aliphaticivorans]